MARVTVEDCLENVENRFELVMVSSKRARQLANEGKEATIFNMCWLRLVGNDTTRQRDKSKRWTTKNTKRQQSLQANKTEQTRQDCTRQHRTRQDNAIQYTRTA